MSGKIKSLLMLTGVLGLTLGSFAIYLNASSRQQDAQAESPPPQATRNIASTTVTDTQGLFFHPEPGKRYTYEFEREIVFEGFPGKNPRVNYHGELYLEVLKTNEQGFEGLTSEKLIEHGKTSPSPLRVQVSSNGEKVKFFTDKSAPQNEESEQHRAIMKDLMAQLIFPLRQDTVGAYEAKFAHWQKTKTRYVKNTPKILHSSHRLKWDAKLNLPEEVQGEEKTETLNPQSKIDVSATSSYKIHFLKVENEIQASAHSLSLMDEPENFALSQTPRSQPAVSFALNRLLDLEHLRSGERMKLFGELLASLRSGTTTPDELAALLQSQNVLKQGAASPLFKTAVGALASLGTPEAQAAAIALYQDPTVPVSGKSTILAAFTTTQASLTDATRAFLSSEISAESDPDLVSGAAYALGASLGNLSGNSLNTGTSTTSLSAQAASSAAQIEQLWATASSAGNVSQEVTALGAMGNSGLPQYLPDLTNVIESSATNDMLKAKAVYALRFITNSEAVSLLDTSLADPSASVRLAAVQAMALAPWNSSFINPLSSCATQEKVMQIQAACQSLLTRNS
jgi:hypothetical protein